MSNPVAQQLREFTVQIRHAESDQVVGTGIVVTSDGKVATCKHVVRDAVRGGVVDHESIVRLRYSGPSHGNRATVQARVVALLLDSDDDVALLAPVGLKLALTSDQVAVLGSPEIAGRPHGFKCFGYRRLDKYQAGIAAGQILGDVPPPEGGVYLRDPVQLLADGGTVNRGMSGSGVLDTDLNLVVGLVSESWSPDDSGRDRDTAWAVDARVLSLEPLGIPIRSGTLPLEPAPEPRSVGLVLPRTSDGGLQVIWNQAPVSVEPFVGRADLLRAISNDWASESVRVTSLIGFGGSGKSYLARRAVEQIIDSQTSVKPTGVFWWGFNSTDSADEFLESLLGFLSGGRIETSFLTSSSARAQVIGSMLGSGRYVIVLDSLEVLQRTGTDDYGLIKSPAMAELMTYLASPLHNSHTIVTSRIELHDLANYTTHLQREVGPLARNEAVSLLRQLGMEAADDALAREAEEWWNHPLALSLVAHLSIASPRGRVPGTSMTGASKRSEIPDGVVDRILRQYDESLPPAHRNLMMILSVFRVPIALTTLRQFVFGGWEGLQTTLDLTEIDPGSIDRMLARLTVLGLCQFSHTNEVVTIHPLAGTHYRGALLEYPEALREFHWRAAVAFVAAYLHLDQPPRSMEAWVGWLNEAREREKEVKATETIAELEPVLEAIHHCGEGGEFDAGWMLHRSLLQRFGRRYLWTRLGAYDASLAALASLFPDRDLTQTPGVSADLVGTVLNTTAIELENVGRAPEAIPLFQRSLAESSDTLASTRVLLNLANAYTALGEFAEASRILEAARSRVHEAGDRELIWDLRLSGARLLSLKGEVEIAAAEFSAVAADYPPEERHRLITLSWADHLMRAGELDAAVEFLEVVLKVYETLDRRADMAASLRILGEVSLRRGEQERALDFFRRGSSLAEVAGDYALRLSLMTSLGRAEARYGDPAAARNRLDVALRMARQGGLRLEEIEALVGHAWVRLRQGTPAEAARIASIARDKSTTIGYHRGVVLATELAEQMPGELEGC